MLRHDVHVRTTFAGSASPSPAPGPAPRRSAARSVTMALRLIVAPLAVLAAAASGLVFVVLLPICGIATIAEGFGKAAWRFVRDTLTHAPHPSARRI